MLRDCRRWADEGRIAEAATLAEAGAFKYPRRPEFGDLAIVLWLELDEPEIALHSCDRLLKEFPDQPRSHFLAAQVYVDLGLLALAGRACRRLGELIPPDPATQTILDHLAAFSDEYIQLTTQGYDFSPEEAEEACALLEEAKVRSRLKDLPAAVEASRRAVERLPRSPDALHLLAVALYNTGKIEEAERINLRLLDIPPHDLQARRRALLCAWVRYDEATVHTAYAPLREQATSGAERSEEERLVLLTLHGMAGEHALAYEVARIIGASGHEIPPGDLPPLLAAAANTGRFQEARGYLRLMRAANVEIPDATVAALNAELSGPNLATAYPYLSMNDILGAGARAALTELLSKADDFFNESPNRPGILKPLLDRWPQALRAAEFALWTDDTVVGLTLLIGMDTEAAYDRIRALLKHPDATYTAQILAVTALHEAGLLADDLEVLLHQGEREVRATVAEVRQVEEPEPLAPGLEALLDEAEAVEEKDPRKAERLLRRIMERYPDDARAYLALGALSPASEGIVLLHQALDRKPGDVNAMCHLALQWLGVGQMETVESLLEEVEQTPLLAPYDYCMLLYVRAYFHLSRHEREQALGPLRRLLREDPSFSNAAELYQQAMRKQRDEGGASFFDQWNPSGRP